MLIIVLVVVIDVLMGLMIENWRLKVDDGDDNCGAYGWRDVETMVEVVVMMSVAVGRGDAWQRW